MKQTILMLSAFLIAELLGQAADSCIDHNTGSDMLEEMVDDAEAREKVDMKVSGHDQ